MPKFVLLWTDVVVWLLIAAVLWYGWHVARRPNLRATWHKVWRDAPALCAAVVMALFAVVAVLDSVHFRRALAAAPGQDANATYYDPHTESLLDLALARPLAYLSFTKETVGEGDAARRDFPRLVHGGAHLKDPEAEWAGDLTRRALIGLLGGALVSALAWLLVTALMARRQRRGFDAAWRDLRADHTELPLRAALLTFTASVLVGGVITAWMNHYHVFGTDRTGNDVFYQALKSIRTAFVIGSLSTLATLPLAVGLGIAAGYFKGWVDEVVQYIYTTLSSIPNVLLIAACVLMVQVFLDKHPELFETGAERADLKLFLLCVILGLTGWAGLARLIRAETLKLRELEYVQAAQAFGVGSWRVMARHIMPNVMHLVLISTVLDFCALILYEAVLSYVGVGVDPSMNSFGGMINLARNEMNRDPVIWWPFASAFFFMVALVLAANLFADGVRDAFDPRARVFRARLVPKRKAA